MSERTRPIVVLHEWKSCDRPDLELMADDRRLVQTLAGKRGGRLYVDERRQGIRITAQSWVGVVRFSTFDLHVRPKLAGGNERLLDLIEFTSGLGALKRCPAVRKLAADGVSLLDLIILMLVEECERILRGGLLSDYVEVEDELPVVRGRLLIDQQFRKRLGRLDRLHCRYDEREQDVHENQVLAHVLGICSRQASWPPLRRKARQLEHVFLGICDPGKLDIDTARSAISYHRLNEHYREAHELSWLILGEKRLSDLYSTGTSRVFAFLLDMNQLFEEFILKLIQRLAGRVSYQFADRSIIRNATTNQPYARVIPDFLVHQNRTRLVLDAKYKLYDSARVSNADIYQSFLYAYAFESDQASRAAAGLIYPSETALAKREDLAVRSGLGKSEARITLLSIPISTALDEAKSGEFGQATAFLRAFLAGGKEVS